MNTMTTKTVQLAANARFVIKAEYISIHEDGDGWGDKAAFHNEHVSVYVDFYAPDGKVFKNGHVQVATPSDREKGIPLVFICGKMKVALRKETAEKVEATIAEAKAEATPVEMTEAEIETAKAEKKAEIADAEKTVAKAEAYVKAHGKLMTRREADAWMKRYNDCLNEGGEGYLPPYPVTAEAYEKALRILSGK